MGWSTLVSYALMSAVALRAQDSWKDPSSHQTKFVEVDAGVRLEVLDWGGSGRSLVLLAGLGNTAHVFDDVAPKLARDYHVYGITRRGYGVSTIATTGFGPDRLADDVLAVIEALKIVRPVLAGHSIAGQELSSIGTRHPQKVAGLVYLDAAYRYAFDDPEQDVWGKLDRLRKNLEALNQRPPDAKNLIRELLEKTLPEFQTELEQLQKIQELAPPPPVAPPAPSPADLASFATLRSWYTRMQGYTPPEAELRQCCEAGSAPGGERRTPRSVSQAIGAAVQKYSRIRPPVLAIYALPHNMGPWANQDPSVREQFAAMDLVTTGGMASAFQAGVPTSRVVRLPNAHHYVFLSNEEDVLREMRAFIGQLP